MVVCWAIWLERKKRVIEGHAKCIKGQKRKFHYGFLSVRAVGC